MLKLIFGLSLVMMVGNGHAGEVISTDIGAPVSIDCHHNDVTPLTQNTNQCPLSDEEFDEFDAAECACLLPVSNAQLDQLSDRQDKEVGKLFLQIIEHNKNQMLETLQAVSAHDLRADPAQDNLCSLDAMTEIIKKRSQLPNNDSFHCSADAIAKNSQKYFETNLQGVLKQLGGPPRSMISGQNLSDSLLIQPILAGEIGQCLGKSTGDQVFQSFIKNFGAEALSKKQAQEKIERLQTQCGIMMSSLADILCEKDKIAPIANKDFIQDVFKHDPFEVDLEDDHYIALQNLYCSDENKAMSEAKKSNNCLESYHGADVESLIRPPLRTNQFADLIECHAEVLGHRNFMRSSNNVNFESRKLDVENEVMACSLLSCKNIQELNQNGNVENNCVARDSENQIVTALNDIGKIQCGQNNTNFCENGKLNEVALSMLNLLVMECRAVECMKDEDLKLVFAAQMAEHPQIREAIETPIDAIKERNVSTKRFWKRFGGDTSTLAQAEQFNESSYLASLAGDFTGVGFREASPVAPTVEDRTQEDPVVIDPSVNSEVTENNSNPLTPESSGESIVAQDDFTPSFSAGSDDSSLEALDREMHINRQLEDALAKITHSREVLANAPLGSEARDRAFQELGRAQARVTGLESQFEDLKRLERRSGVESDGNFKSRFAGSFASTPMDMNFTRTGKSLGAKNVSVGTAPRRLSQGSLHSSAGMNTAIRIDPRKQVQQQDHKKDSLVDVNARALPRPIPVPSSGGSADQTTLDAARAGTTSVARSPASSVNQPASLNGTLKQVANNLSLASLARKDLDPQNAYGAEIIVSPKKEKIDLLAEVLSYKQKHPEFQLGQVLTVKQLDHQTGTYKKARLIPLFDTNGSFDGYGISSDAVMRAQLVYKSFERIKFRDLSRNEAYQLEMDIIVAQRN